MQFPDMLSYVVSFFKVKKIFTIFSPCSCHLALARVMMPLTFSSYRVSNSFFVFSMAILVEIFLTVLRIYYLIYFLCLALISPVLYKIKWNVS